MIRARVTLDARDPEEISKRLRLPRGAAGEHLPEASVGQQSVATEGVVGGGAIHGNDDLGMVEGGTLELDSLIGHREQKVNHRGLVRFSQSGFEFDVEVSNKRISVRVVGNRKDSSPRVEIDELA